MLASTHVGRQTTTIEPTFYINGDPEKFYTLIMLDHDVPSPDSPWLHMLYINIPGSPHPTSIQPKQITPYSATSRPLKTGRHDYITTLYEQPFPIQGQCTIGDWGRANFNIGGFVAKYGLKPVGETAFYIEWTTPNNSRPC